MAIYLFVSLLLDIDRSHVLQNPSPQTWAPVRHGTVLHSPGKHHHVTSLPLHLDGVLVEVVLVIRVPGVLVRVGSDSSAAIL